MMRGARYLSLSQAYPDRPHVSPQLFRTSMSFCFARLPVPTVRTACRKSGSSGSAESTTPSPSGTKKAGEKVIPITVG